MVQEVVDSVVVVEEDSVEEALAALAVEALAAVAQADHGKIILQFNNTWQGIL